MDGGMVNMDDGMMHDMHDMDGGHDMHDMHDADGMDMDMAGMDMHSMHAMGNSSMHMMMMVSRQRFAPPVKKVISIIIYHFFILSLL